jgi:hypothetical protein
MYRLALFAYFGRNEIDPEEGRKTTSVSEEQWIHTESMKTQTEVRVVACW